MTNETGSNQSEIETRIKDMPRTRTQHVYTGIETEVKKNNMLIRTGELINEGIALFVGKKKANIKEFEVKKYSTIYFCKDRIASRYKWEEYF